MMNITWHPFIPVLFLIISIPVFHFSTGSPHPHFPLVHVLFIPQMVIPLNRALITRSFILLC